MRSITSADAKNNSGELIDLARAAPVAVTKYDRPVVVAVELEEERYERMMALKAPKHSARSAQRSERLRPCSTTP